ncbi:MAG: phosphatidylglycerophosphatase A [Synergistaceae bacterium]|jgi:phosphatidylglycerophosphatase A|nr:phosphatidylglycerophosphatase A [Synergistaceae bacterium]
MNIDREPDSAKPPIGAWRNWYALVATFFGVGRLSKMPGTLGTFVAFLLFILFGGINVYAFGVIVAVGTLAADRYVKMSASDTHDEIIIDKIAGYWAAMLGLDSSYSIIVFFLFRIAGILKPFPMSMAERLPGGIGIMADDISCGIIINVIVRMLTWLFFKQGFDVIYQYLGIGA